jgi:predicted alpha/beta superfamily hydrolase
MLLRYLENNRQQPEEKKRPIVLIGHSLGGILVKKVLLSNFPKFLCVGLQRELLTYIRQ